MLPKTGVKAFRRSVPAEIQHVPAFVTAAEEQQHAQSCLQFFIEQLTARRLNPKTISFYEADLKLFREAVAKDLLEVQRADIYRVMEAWKGLGASDATIARRAAALRQFYDLIFAAGLISVRPTANLRLPKAWVRVQRVAPAEELERVIAAIGTRTPYDLRDRALLLLLRDTGPRANAVAQLELRDVDWQQGQLFLRNDKFGKQHNVPLSKRTLEAFQDYVQRGRPHFLHGRDVPLLFLWSKGNAQPLSRVRIWQICDGWTTKVLGKSYSPHCWRRTLLTEGAEKHMDVYDLMIVAGHSSPDTTNRYIHHTIAEQKRVFYESHPRARKGPK